MLLVRWGAFGSGKCPWRLPKRRKLEKWKAFVPSLLREPQRKGIRSSQQFSPDLMAEVRLVENNSYVWLNSNQSNRSGRSNEWRVPFEIKCGERCFNVNLVTLQLGSFSHKEVNVCASSLNLSANGGVFCYRAREVDLISHSGRGALSPI